MIFYLIFGSTYATWWILSHEDHVQQSIIDAESEVDKPTNHRVIKFTLLLTLFTTVAVLWPIRFFRDFVEEN